jgi:hypothetical protein
MKQLLKELKKENSMRPLTRFEYHQQQNKVRAIEQNLLLLKGKYLEPLGRSPDQKEFQQLNTNFANLFSAYLHSKQQRRRKRRR